MGRNAAGRLLLFAALIAGGGPAGPVMAQAPAKAPTPSPAAAPTPSPAPEQAGQARRCSEPEYRQFDFWLGDWEVRAPDGQVAGTNRITKILDGCALREQWSGASGTSGTSLNAFDAGSGRWHQTWVDSSGQVLRLDGVLRDGKMVLSGVAPASGGRVTQHRITWEKAGTEVLQIWEQSEDGGVTWTRIFEGLYTRRQERGGSRAP